MAVPVVEHRTAQGLVDAAVDDLGHGVAPALAHVFADPVADDHGVMHREADDGQQRGNHGEIDLVIDERQRADARSSTSWIRATAAPTPKRSSKRNQM